VAYNLKVLAIPDVNVWPLIDSALKIQPEQPEQPEPPPFSDFKEGVTTYTVLSDKERDAWKTTYQLLKDYQILKYNNQVKKLTEVSKHIFATLSSRNVTYIEGKSTPWEKLVALKSRLAPSTRVRELELARE
jgi:hypothetical protein